MSDEATKLDPADLIPADPETVAAAFPHLFSRPGQVAWLLRRREENGLARAIVKLGPRRLFLSRSRFAEWLSQQTEAA